MRLNQDLIQRMFDGRGGASGGGSSLDPGLINGLATEMWTEENYVSKTFFNELFVIHKKTTTTVYDGDTVVSTTVDTSGTFAPNEIPSQEESTDEETGYRTVVVTEVDNIEAKKGLWTDFFLSALGLNGSGGGGGIGDVTWQALGDNTDTRQIASSHLTTALGSALAGYATQSWVTSQNYVTSSAISDMATKTWVNNQSFVNWTALGDTTTTQQIALSHLTTALSGYATQTWVTTNFSTPATVATQLQTYAKIQNGTITIGDASLTPITSVSGTFWGKSFTNGGTVNGTIKAGSNGGAIEQFHSVEMNSAGTLAGYGGFIDFHYYATGSTFDSSLDYTSRIIESEVGVISILAKNNNATNANKLAGLLVGAGYDGSYIQIGDLRIVYDSTNNALKVVKLVSGSEVAANFYATGSVSALGYGAGGGGGTGDVTWTNLADNTDTRQIALSHLTGALAGYATTSQLAGYLPLTGGTMTGKLKFANESAISNRVLASNSGAFFVFIDAFNSGGELHYANKTDITNYLDLSNLDYLPLTGGTLSKSGRETLILNDSSTTASVSGPYISFRVGGAGKTTIGFNSQYGSFIEDFSTNVQCTLLLNGSSLTYRSYKVWYEDNDGSGSGLDADLLDGQHGSYYATVTSLSNYLPLTGGKLSGNLKFASTGITQDTNCAFFLTMDSFGNGGEVHYADLSVVTTVLNGYYLPKTGGTLANTNNNILNLNNSSTNASLVYMYFKTSGTNKASIGYNNGFAGIANETSYARIGILDDGTPQYWSGQSSTTAHTIYHTGNIPDFLLKSGGTMTGKLKFASTAMSNISLSSSSTAFFVFMDAFSSGGELHYANKTDLLNFIGLSNYLPLTGGTLTNTNRDILKLNNTSSDSVTGPYITFKVSGTIKSNLGYNSTVGTFVEDFSSGTAYDLCLKAASITYNSKKVWYEDNDGSGSGLDADLLDGEHASAFVTLTGAQTISGAKSFTDIRITNCPEDTNMPFFIGINAWTSGGIVRYVSAANAHVGYADKLATAITLWGNNFDGSTSIEGTADFGCGNFAGTNPSLGALNIGTVRVRASYSDGRKVNYGLYSWVDFNTGRGSFQCGYQNGNTNPLPMSLQPLGGNVGIGTGTSSPSYKLHVAGTFYASGAATLGSTLSVGGTTTVTGNVVSGNTGGAIEGFHSWELNTHNTAGTNIGGFLDFHYNGTAQDYSVRLIEKDYSGVLQILAKDTGTGNAQRAGLIVGAGTYTSFIQIGNGRIVWNDTDHALRIVDKDGNACNLYATGGISALGYQSGGGGGGSTGVFSTSITPDTTGTYDIGTSTYKWRNLYLAGANGGNGFSIITSYSSYVYIGSLNKILFGADVEFEDTAYVENRMGIGVKNGNYDLYVYGENEGNAYFAGEVSVASLTNRSDMRLKDVVGDVNLSVQQIASAPTFKFKFKEKAKRTMVGTSAQYWDAVLPESVTRDADGILGLDYGVTALVSTIILAKGMTEHERRITKLEKENAELRARIKDLEEN